jgi:hypothetical protein
MEVAGLWTFGVDEDRRRALAVRFTEGAFGRPAGRALAVTE